MRHHTDIMWSTIRHQYYNKLFRRLIFVWGVSLWINEFFGVGDHKHFTCPYAHMYVPKHCTDCLAFCEKTCRNVSLCLLCVFLVQCNNCISMVKHAHDTDFRTEISSTFKNSLLYLITMWKKTHRVQKHVLV